MNNKGLETKKLIGETPDVLNISNKPLKQDKDRVKRVDINILKSRIQDKKSKENRQNLIIFIFFIFSFCAITVYLTA